MNNQVLGILFFVIGISVLGQFSDSFGHGLGSETMPPVMIGDTEATLEVNSVTNWITVDEEEVGVRQITINLFESFTNINSVDVESISDVTFEVELIKADTVLIKETFQRDDGILIMNLTPSENEKVKILEHETFASFFGLASEQYNFEGKIFENGGLYEFKITVITINSYDNVLTDPVNYDLGISIEETTRYEINDVNYGKQEIGIVTFFDQISDFNYNTETKEITFSFPFNWDQKTIEQTTVIHEEILVPKTYGELLVTKYDATLNGLDLPESMINIDDFSSDDRIVHIVVSQEELQEIFSNNQFDEDLATITVTPQSALPLTGITENGQYKINLFWDDELKSGNSATIRYEILDTFLKDKPIPVTYDLKIFHDGKNVFTKNGMSSDKKEAEMRAPGANDLTWDIPPDVTGLIVVKFENLSGSQYANLEFPIIIDRKSNIIEYQIPEWVKNNAGWWAGGQIPDSAFIDGIEFLIKEGIIIVPIVESEEQGGTNVPEWVKNNAGWWAGGQIDDKSFATGIEFLIKIGLIVV
tara:strand:- start:181 stop:1776 length:1596 start_codon:yes stop_codon:yes gene_type:complete